MGLGNCKALPRPLQCSHLLTPPLYCSATPPHQPFATRCCNHCRGWKTSQTSKTSGGHLSIVLLSPLSPLCPGCPQPAPCSPQLQALRWLSTAWCTIAAGPGEDTLKDNAAPKPASHRGCSSAVAGGRKGGRAPWRQLPPHQHLPDAQQAPLGAVAQPQPVGEKLGQNPLGREGSTGTAVPTPSQHSGMARSRAGKDVQAGQTVHRVLAQGTVLQQAGAKQSSVLAQPLASIYSGAPALR